ncbi:MAG TPA: PASTA domain-containing protein, partial [Elusimicrobiota bacterium]|nr:PASTA domain-containing protein [Elusimicrobiota bacterium]
TPAIAGLPLRNAEMLLRQNQINLGEVTETYSLKLEKGLVLSQDPKSESSVERNSLVNVVVSAGPPPDGIVLMPDFQRKTLSEATTWATGAGVKLAVTKDNKSLFAYGTVLSQDPAPDTAVSPKDLVRLTVSGKAGGAKVSAAGMNFHYQVPSGGADSLVRIVVVDNHGERELFNGLRAPGSKIDLSVPSGGRARVKIFLNGILVEEKDL